MAWRNGVSAAERGDIPAGLRWLERALGLAPSDARIGLDLANIRLLEGSSEQLSRAVLAFEALTARYDVASLWLGLMAARRLQGDHAQAAAALHSLLSRHCVPEDQGFAAVALAVAVAADKPGWCGVDASGRLHIAAPDGAAAFVDGAPAVLTNLCAAPQHGTVTVVGNGIGLLGSPLKPAMLRRCEGLVETAGSALTGWVSRPAAPLHPPELVLQDAEGNQRLIPLGNMLPAGADSPLTPRYGFRCSISMLQALQAPFRLMGPDGAEIFGSPVDAAAEMAVTPIPAAYLGPANRTLPERAPLAVVVPVYRGLDATQTCLRAALSALPAAARLIIVDDATPEPALRACLDGFCADARVQLIRHDRNLGFAAAANAGLAAASGCDVLLLNSDALLAAPALERLLAAAYARAEIGSVTPFSNEATICSYPCREGGNAAPDAGQSLALNEMAMQANGNAVVEIPTGVGFCLLMRHDCLAKTGLFRPEIFAQGYREEVDWCLRARHRGFRHVAATGAYVAHLGRASFGAAGGALNLRNNRVLRRLYPGFEKLIDAHAAADPLAPARRRLDAARFGAGRCRSAVLLISHHHGGGVARRIEVEMQEIRRSGRRPIVLSPAMQGETETHYPYPAALTDGAAADYPNLRITLPGQAPELIRILQAERVDHVVLHHGLGHHPSLRNIAAKLGCPLEIVIHDYASFCPRVHLMGVEQRYCGEPATPVCQACVDAAGDATLEGLGVERLLARSRDEFGSARRVIAPSADASRRIARHFPNVTPAVTPWEDDALPRRLRPPGGLQRRIAVIGGIGIAKGYNVLLECGQDAARRQLPLEFVLCGSSSDDEQLLQTGRVFVTGAYRAEALPEMLGGLHADLAFIPSIWPETWCYTLGEAWSAGLFTIAFDLGAQAERIAATRRGGLLPLGLPAPRVNDALLSWNPA
jgi:GT2 family glycosyltransferase